MSRMRRLWFPALAPIALAMVLASCSSDDGGPPPAWVVADGERVQLRVAGHCWGEAECVDAEPGSAGPPIDVAPGGVFRFEFEAGPPATAIVTAFRTDGEGEHTPLAPVAGGWRAPDIPGNYQVSVAGTWPGKGEAAYSLKLRVSR